MPVFLAVPGGELVPVFPLGGQSHEQTSEPAVTEPHTPSPLPLAPTHPHPSQPSPAAEHTESTAPAGPTASHPTEPALPRPSAPAGSAFDDFDEGFFDESGPFGGSLPPFPDISSIFADVEGASGRSDDADSAPAGAGEELRPEGRSAESAIRRLDSAWQDSDSDSGWPTQDSDKEYAELYFRASEYHVSYCGHHRMLV